MCAARPQVVAHRGASEIEPEHTLAAYRRAIESGADALECDVRLTADGHLVCVHDRSLDRTSNGHGLVSTHRLAQLEELDWGSWKPQSTTSAGTSTGPPAAPSTGTSADLSTRESTGTSPGTPAAGRPARQDGRDRSQLLTLRRLLSLVADAGRPIELAIETKHPTRWGGLVERKLGELLGEFGWATPREPGHDLPVRVMSFSWLALRRMRHYAPGVPLVFLLERVPFPFRDGHLPPGVATAGIGVTILRSQPEYVRQVLSRGNEVHVWTVDQPEDVDRCVAAGVGAIITNRPAAVLSRLDELAGRAG